MYVCMYECVYVCMGAYMYVCMYVYMYLYMYVYMYVCIYVSIYVCVYVCIYVCMHARERDIFFYLTTHSTHFIYGYMASDMWLRTILIVRKETRCRHIGYSYRLTAPSHRQDTTYHGLFVTPVVEHWLEREIRGRIQLSYYF